MRCDRRDLGHETRTVDDQLAEIWFEFGVRFRRDDVGVTEECDRSAGTQGPSQGRKTSRFLIGANLGNVIFLGEPDEEVGDFLPEAFQECLLALSEFLELLVGIFRRAMVLAAVQNDQSNVVASCKW